MINSTHTRRTFRFGAMAWTFWMVFYAFFFHYFAVPDLAWSVAIGASFGSYIPYALMSIGLWYICKALPIGKWPVIGVFTFHFFLSVLVSALWLFLTYGWWYLSSGNDIFVNTNISGYIGWQYLFGMMTCLLINGIFYSIINYEALKDNMRKEAALKISSRDAELLALRMQINPHFLFNTLNSINALITSDPNGARDMIAGLSELFRSTLEQGDEILHCVSDELELARRYLSIESTRFGQRLKITEDIDLNINDYAIPVLMLQPLLENAVKHGVARHRGDAHIEFYLGATQDQLICKISNTLGEVWHPSTGPGTGLGNLRKRLSLIYPYNYLMDTGPDKDNVYHVHIEIPLERCHDTALSDCR
ncbi:histidine kinase [bacterium]|nr:histidine kinase [bacterium]